MFPQDLGAQCGLRSLASHIARMNIARYMVFLALGLLLGMLLSSLVAWLMS